METINGKAAPEKSVDVISEKKARPLRLNRNLMNFPLARPVRTRVPWKYSKRKSRWWADLPGENRIRLRFPRNAPRRAPTDLDMSVLFLVLEEAQQLPKDAAAVVRFPTVSAVLKRLELALDQKARDRVYDALEMLSHIEIESKCWYGAAGSLTLPPPVLKCEREGRGLRVEIDPTWTALTKRGYFVPVPLPLPRDAAAQNLALMLLARNLTGCKWEGCDRSTLARKVGITRKNRKARLQAALERVERWFSKQGGVVKFEFKPRGRITLGVVQPWALEEAAATYDRQEVAPQEEIDATEAFCEAVQQESERWWKARAPLEESDESEVAEYEVHYDEFADK
jgi:hypothetical protein